MIILIIMVAGIAFGLAVKGYRLPAPEFGSLHPGGKTIWPYMFVTVACGAVAGFHATQSPMMARCIESEFKGRKIFYGAMIVEGVIAFVWAAAGQAFYGTAGNLQNALTTMGFSEKISYLAGIAFAFLCTVLFLLKVRTKRRK